MAFTGKLDNGEIFYVVEKDNPMSVALGSGDLPPTVESAILEMKVGDTKKIRVPPDEGYGPRQKDLLQVIESEEMVASIKPLPGMVLSLQVEKDGQPQKVPATVIQVDGPKVTVDYNHPLAGHHLTYELVLLDIIKAAVH